MTGKQHTWIKSTLGLVFLDPQKLTTERASALIEEVKQKWNVTPFTERRTLINEIKAKYSL